MKLKFQNIFIYLLIFLMTLLTFSCDKTNPVGSSALGFLANPGPILFVSDKSGTSQLYSMNEDGSNVQQLTNDPNFPITDARWSPDGNKIALVSSVGGVSLYGGAIYIVNADGSGKYLLTKSSITVKDSALGNIIYQGASNPVWSPDGKEIAYYRLMVPEVYDNRDVFLINIDGSNEIRVTKTIRTSETINAWSYDKNYLLVSISDSSITSKVIKLILANGSEEVISNLYNSNNAKISKDDKFIFFTAWNDNSKRFEIYRSDENGNNKEIIATTTNTFNYVASLSPDNNSFLVNSVDDKNPSKPTFNIYLKNIITGNLKNITSKEVIDSYNIAVSWKGGE
ncbi:MAG: TolB family protein [Ignavibacteriaceae bacterium]